MPHRFWVVPALGLGLVLSTMSQGNQQSDATKERAKLLQAQQGAARKTYDKLWSFEEINNVEVLYQWSRRWLEVDRLIQDKKQDQIAAVRSHLERMRNLQQRSNNLFRQKLTSEDQVTATDFYVAEAEMWLLQAKQ